MDLASLWRVHQTAPYPHECLGLSFRGRTLLKLDSRIGALLTASLRTDGRPRALPPGEREELERGRKEIEALLGEMPLEGAARDYFVRLEALSAAVLGAKP